MCDCKPNLSESERWGQQVLLELPDSIERQRRIDNELSTQVCIDPCIVNEIRYLWANGIITNGCCCGHNNPDLYPFVNVYPECSHLMIELGYINSNNPNNGNTFFLGVISVKGTDDLWWSFAY